MRNVYFTLLLGAAATSVAAQVPSLCDQPTYATSFRSSYPKILAVRQGLGRTSEEESVSRLSRLRDAISASNLVDAAELSKFLDGASESPDMVDQRKEQQKATQSYDGFQRSFDVIPIMAGNDPAKQAKAFCVMGKASLVALAKKRKASEQIGALTQQRLIAFGSSKGVAYSDQLVATLQPSMKACNSEAGAAAAEEEVELYLDSIRTEQRKLEAELDSQIKARSQLKGWSKQRVSEIFAKIPTLPEFAALESRKRPLVAEVQSWVQMELGGSKRSETTEPCTSPIKCERPAVPS